MNPPNNIQNGFFTPVSHFFSKVRKLTVFSRNPHTPIIPQSVRLRMGTRTGHLCLFPAVRPVRPAHSNSSETKKIICPTHAAHVGHMIGLTPSTSCELLPPPAGGPPPSRREVWGFRILSKPRIQPRVQGRNPARFKGGYGVPRGFKGEKSKFPPNPLGLAERVYSFHRCGGPPPSRREV